MKHSHFSISEFISFFTFADKQIPQEQIDKPKLNVITNDLYTRLAVKFS